jgi:2-polyprenyl-3-methyl-5-hydroxy-6-metoxy-1,4-benzoquinol methylase
MVEKFGKDYFYGNKESNYSDYDKLNPSKQFKNVISFIKNQKLKGRFLDVGCAFGLLLKEVSSFFDEIYGCDISQFAIKKAQQKVPKAHLKLTDLDSVDDLPYPNKFFNCITALDVLEHTKKFEDNFKKIVAKLKSGGYLIISVPIDSWPRKFFGFLDKDKTHISILKEDKIMKIVSKNKLTVISKKHFCPIAFFYRIPYIPAEVELIFKK